MQDHEGMMMRLSEHIQACLRIFRRAQHLWIVRDILHQAQGVFYVFVLLPDMGSRGSNGSRGSTPSNPSNPWLKNKERKDALYAGCPCRAPDVWDAHTQGDASLCPGLCACYPFRVLTWQYDERTRFIYFCLTSTIRPGSHTWSCWT